MTTTTTMAQRRQRHSFHALAVTPLPRWLVAHHAVAPGTVAYPL